MLVTVMRTIELDVEIDVEIEPGSPDHYNRSIGGPGGWSPGCPPSAEVVEIRSASGSILRVTDELTRAELASIRDAAIEQAGEAEEDAAAAHADDERDRLRDEAHELRGER
jgi:hypothetical protein